MTVSMTPRQKSLVEGLVRSGRYQSSSEVMRDALRALEEREEARKAAVERVRRMIAEGSAQADRGEGRPASQVFADLRRRVRGVRRKAG